MPKSRPRCVTSLSSSSKVPSSRSNSMRSRAESLPSLCWRFWRSSPPPCSAAVWRRWISWSLSMLLIVTEGRALRGGAGCWVLGSGRTIGFVWQMGAWHTSLLHRRCNIAVTFFGFVRFFGWWATLRFPWVEPGHGIARTEGRPPGEGGKFSDRCERTDSVLHSVAFCHFLAERVTGIWEDATQSRFFSSRLRPVTPQDTSVASGDCLFRVVPIALRVREAVSRPVARATRYRSHRAGPGRTLRRHDVGTARGRSSRSAPAPDPALRPGVLRPAACLWPLPFRYTRQVRGPHPAHRRHPPAQYHLQAQGAVSES